MNKIHSLVRELESDYQSGTVTKSEYVSYNLLQKLNTIDAYANSKHISGDKDSLGRDKPFFNIVVSAMNIWYRATDIDRSNITLEATKEQDYILSFVGNIMVQEWMRKNNFGKFLNKWGRVLAKYGTAILKFVEKDGKLVPQVVDWNTLIVDPINFYANPVIEVLQLTPGELRKKSGYDQEQVEELIEALQTRETIDGNKKDKKLNIVKLYEIHGELPLSYLTDDEEDDEKYVQQVQVVSFVQGEDDEYKDFVLYKGKEDNPYMKTDLIEEDGETLSKGAVEHLFESQWMTNHSMKSIKDQLDLASKLIYQSSDPSFLGMNALQDVENGRVLIHAINQPLTQVNNNSHDITSLQNQKSEWKAVGNEITGISEAMQGASAKAGTAWRQTEALLQESHSLFELMTENKGLAIEEMFAKFLLPHIKKYLKNNKKEIVAKLSDNGIEKIERRYIKAEAMKKAKKEFKDKLLAGDVRGLAQVNTQGYEAEIKSQLDQMGEDRFIFPSEVTDKTWDEMFKDFEWKVSVDVTGESKDSKAHMATLVTLFQTLMAQQNLDAANKVMGKILEMTGAMSPVEISSTKLAPVLTATAPESMGAITANNNNEQK